MSTMLNPIRIRTKVSSKLSVLTIYMPLSFNWYTVISGYTDRSYESRGYTSWDAMEAGRNHIAACAKAKEDSANDK